MSQRNIKHTHMVQNQSCSAWFITKTRDKYGENGSRNTIKIARSRELRWCPVNAIASIQRFDRIKKSK